MTPDWPTVRLGDVANFETGFPFKSALYTDNFEHHKLVRGDNVVQRTFRWDGCKYWNYANDGSLDKYLLEAEDIVLAMDRPWIEAGLKYSMVREADLPALLVQRVTRLRKTGKVTGRFLNYVIGSQNFTDYILGVQTGTAVPHISLRQIKNYAFNCPPLETQRAIAHILGMLDDKIELNRRTNGTLEEIARALFKSWFVDFDPVRAKMAGRQPEGMDAETAALFPDGLEGSGLAEVPAGWKIGPVSYIGDVICGKTPSTKVTEYYGGDIPFITIPDMRNRVFAFSTARKLSEVGALSQAKKMLPKGTICVSCIATPGLVTLTDEPSQTNQQINSVVPNLSKSFYYWYYAFRGLGEEITTSGSGGSVYANLSTSRFAALKVLFPPPNVIRKFHSQADSLLSMYLMNEKESLTLGSIRDALLPKLLSGDLRVPEAESVVETAL